MLQRFVNFMNNPDERTAVEQFGKGDKYFGVAVMLVTMPGLPMIGHGQIEGFAEKYGMEYKRAYWDEPVDEGMVRRHEREVFPLMRRRALFSGAENFALFDFITPDGHVDENVFTYCNRHHDERALILFNNAYEGTRGHLHTSSAINTAPADADPHLERRGLSQALALNTDPGMYYAFRELTSGLEFLRNAEQLAREGLHAELRGYQFQVFMDWRELRDHQGRWAALHHHLGGRGVPSLHQALREQELAPLLTRLTPLMSPAALERLTPAEIPALATDWVDALSLAMKMGDRNATRRAPDTDDLQEQLLTLAAAVTTPPATVIAPEPGTEGAQDQATATVPPTLAYMAWSLRRLAMAMGTAVAPEPGAETAPSPGAFPWRLPADDQAIIQTIARSALTGRPRLAHGPDAALALADLVARHPGLLSRRLKPSIQLLFADQNAAKFLHCNNYQGTWYFGKERFEALVEVATTALPLLADVDATEAATAAERLLLAAAEGGYQQQALLDALDEEQESASAAEPDGVS